MTKCPQTPAMIPAAPVVSAPLLSGAVLCAVSLVASARPLAIKLPKLPNIQLPELPELPELKLPDLDLPNFGKKKEKAPAKKQQTPSRAPVSGNVKVRAASGVAVSREAANAPTLADIRGEQSQETIAAGEGWKRYPARRMPGANMDGWKKIAKDIAPKI